MPEPTTTCRKCGAAIAATDFTRHDAFYGKIHRSNGECREAVRRQLPLPSTPKPSGRTGWCRRCGGPVAGGGAVCGEC